MNNRSMLIDIVGEQPEHISLRFITSGPQGGDSGHGAEAELTIAVESGEYELAIKRDERTRQLSEATFMARGDWEVNSLEESIVRLALAIIRERLGLSLEYHDREPADEGESETEPEQTA
jgi:hypothetical protein